MVQAGQGQRLAEPEPLPPGRDPDDVDLADVGCVGVAACTFVQWEPSSSASRSARKNRPGRTTARRIRCCRSSAVIAPLLGVVGEGGGVDRDPGILVLTGLEGADVHVAAGMTAAAIGRSSAAPHLPEVAHPREPEPVGQQAGGCVVAVRPDRAGRVDRRARTRRVDQGGADAAPACRRRHDEVCAARTVLGGAGRGARTRRQRRRSRRRASACRPDSVAGAAWQVEPHLVVERRRPRRRPPRPPRSRGPARRRPGPGRRRRSGRGRRRPTSRLALRRAVDADGSSAVRRCRLLASAGSSVGSRTKR